MKKVLEFVIVISTAACIGGSGNAPQDGLPFETLTPLVASAEPYLELQAQIDDLRFDVSSLETEVADLETEIAEREAQIAATETQVAATPTATAKPIIVWTSTPSNVMTVVVIKKVNLRKIGSYNNANKPIMVIQEPRVQYQVGETFQVKKYGIVADGGDKYYEVVGPRGVGLYVRGSDVKPTN